MRIVQIIDTLDAGGAEKMAINYANALSSRILFSGIIATRKEGELLSQIENPKDYFFLNRKKTIDFGAVFRLKSYLKTNKIDFIQAHSSSFFIAVCTKIFYPKVKIIWHDHNGLSEFVSANKSFLLKISSFLFKGIIVVNYQLKNWAQKELNCKKVVYFANYTSFNNKIEKHTILEGIEGKRIVCIANLRYQKNHFLLLQVAKKMQISHPEWTFHCVGKDFEDDYSNKVKLFIANNKLKNVYLQGSKNDISNIIEQSTIGILTSDSEGLPVALLEYGLHKKPVISTSVGEIPLIINDNINGFIVPVGNSEMFYNALIKLINDQKLCESFGQALHNTVLENNSENAVMKQYLDWINKL